MAAADGTRKFLLQLADGRVVETVGAFESAHMYSLMVKSVYMYDVSNKQRRCCPLFMLYSEANAHTVTSPLCACTGIPNDENAEMDGGASAQQKAARQSGSQGAGVSGRRQQGERERERECESESTKLFWLCV